MDLILWRHAKAEDSQPDFTRVLTTKGQKQAVCMAMWLKKHLPADCNILVSPATRTVQTADALGLPYETHTALMTDATPEGILTAANWPNHKNSMLIIGHQPTLGQVASLLMTGEPQDCHIKKNSVWWLSQKKGCYIQLEAVISIDYLDE